MASRPRARLRASLKDQDGVAFDPLYDEELERPRAGTIKDMDAFRGLLIVNFVMHIAWAAAWVYHITFTH